MSELDGLRYEVNDLEQYGRRNSIRLNNFKLIITPKSEEELTECVMNFLNESVLQYGRPLEMRDIERCHYVGKAIGDRPKQIIIKFSHYQDKRRVFAAKSKLKNNRAKTFITEDLTSANHTVVKELLLMKKAGKIDSFWTNN